MAATNAQQGKSGWGGDKEKVKRWGGKARSAGTNQQTDKKHKQTLKLSSSCHQL